MTRRGNVAIKSIEDKQRLKHRTSQVRPSTDNEFEEFQTATDDSDSGSCLASDDDRGYTPNEESSVEESTIMMRTQNGDADWDRKRYDSNDRRPQIVKPMHKSAARKVERKCESYHHFVKHISVYIHSAFGHRYARE